jgi:lysophospholipase L1-like esterase
MSNTQLCLCVSEYVILTDSIGKYVSQIPNTVVRPYPGITIDRMVRTISQCPDLISGYKKILLHVGTNNVNGMSVDQILDNYVCLVNKVKSINYDANIIVSAIIPRPVDFDRTDDKVKAINKRLQALCKQLGVQFATTFRPFLKGGTPVRNWYAIRDGGLHLNLDGARKLCQFFTQVLSN